MAEKKAPMRNHADGSPRAQQGYMHALGRNRPKTWRGALRSWAARVITRTIRPLEIATAVAAIAALSSCALTSRTNLDAVLRAMRLDQQTFSELDLCQQVRAYTDVGMQFLDRDHKVALVPAWMDDILARQTPAEVAACIGQEGKYRLGLFAAQLASRTDTSLAVLALGFKAHQLKVMTNPDVRSFLDASVCAYDLEFSSGLVLTYYLDRFGEMPPYYSAPDDTVKMRAELCAR